MKAGIFMVALIIFAVMLISMAAYSSVNSHTYFNAAKCSANPTEQNCGAPTGITCFRTNSTIIDFICIHFWIRNNNLYLQKVYIPNLSN
jgi:hypothetical protein